MFPVLSAESAPYYVQYSRNEPPFCKPYARRRFPFHTDKSPRYSFCFFLSVLNLFKKKIFLFSHNIQPQTKRFANVFATSQFFPKPFAFSLLPPRLKLFSLRSAFPLCFHSVPIRRPVKKKLFPAKSNLFYQADFALASPIKNFSNNFILLKKNKFYFKNKV